LWGLLHEDCHAVNKYPDSIAAGQRCILGGLQEKKKIMIRRFSKTNPDVCSMTKSETGTDSTSRKEPSASCEQNKALKRERRLKRGWRMAFSVLLIFNIGWGTVALTGQYIIREMQESQYREVSFSAYRHAANRYILLAKDEWNRSAVMIPKYYGFGREHPLYPKACNGADLLSGKSLIGTNCYVFDRPVRALPEKFGRLKNPNIFVFGIPRDLYTAILEKGFDLERLTRPCDFLPDFSALRKAKKDDAPSKLSYDHLWDLAKEMRVLRCASDPTFRLVLQIYDSNRHVEDYVEIKGA
jgi:hypothetical protein